MPGELYSGIEKINIAAKGLLNLIRSSDLIPDRLVVIFR
jgi:hypothetical protein